MQDGPANSPRRRASRKASQPSGAPKTGVGHGDPGVAVCRRRGVRRSWPSLSAPALARCAAALAFRLRRDRQLGRSASPPVSLSGSSSSASSAASSDSVEARRCAAARSRRAGCRSRTSRDGWRDTAYGGASNRGRLVLVHSSARCHIAARQPHVSPWIMILLHRCSRR